MCEIVFGPIIFHSKSQLIIPGNFDRSSISRTLFTWNMLDTCSMAESKFEVKVIPTKEEYARLVDVLWAANFNPYK